jgi:hypothetical protein
MLRFINPPAPSKNIITNIATNTINGLLSFLDKIKLNSLFYSDQSLHIANLPNGGSIGSAINTVDKTMSICINQTTPSQNLLIPTPSNINNVRYLLITNTGNTGFTLLNKILSPEEINMYVWNTTSWNLIATSIPTSLINFNVVSSSTNYTITTWNTALIVDTSGVTLNITLPPTTNISVNSIVVITRHGSNAGNINILSNPSNPLNIMPFNNTSITNQLSNLYESITIMSTINGPLLLSDNKIDPLFHGATSLINGKIGWVPYPTTGVQNLFLKGESNWKAPLLEVRNIISNTTTTLDYNIEYHVNTISGTATVNLPSTPNNGSIIKLIDVTNTWNNNSLIVIPALGNTINGSTSSVVLTTGIVIELYFDTNFNNWIMEIYNNILDYKGNWDANTNNPVILSGIGNKGDYYKVSVSGNTNINGISNWNINDVIIFNGDEWDIIKSSTVFTVNNLNGNVVLDAIDFNLNNVNNTSDLNKPISTNTQNAINNKLDYPVASFLNQTINPSNPNTNNVKLYSKSDYKLYTLNNLGEENSLENKLNYLGLWDANTNTPIIISGIGNIGDYYKVSVSGNTTINGINNWNISDWIIFNGSNWDKLIINLELNDSEIYIGNASNVPVSMPISGDLTINNFGITTIKDSVNLNGVPTLTNTPLYLDDSNKIANTEFVQTSKILNSILFTNQTMNGILGSLTEVNDYDKFVVTQSSTNINFSLPVPSINKLMYIENNGTSTFSIYNNIFVKPNQYVQMHYNGNNWIEVSKDKSIISVDTNNSLINDIDYVVDTNLNEITLTLPNTLINGSQINLLDKNKSWFKNKLTLSNNIDNMNNIQIENGGNINLCYDTNSNRWISNNDTQIIPNMRMSNYSRSGLYNYLSELLSRNKNIDNDLRSYTHGATVVEGSYGTGGVYSPTQNRIYLVPYGQSSSTTWHYINCETGSIVAYTGILLASLAYAGGVYSPTQNRIYFIPHVQSSSTTWHYIDCNTGNVVGYTAPSLISMAYFGGVYSPIQNRIYMTPHEQSIFSTWHYIDCNTGNVVGYTALSLISVAYRGGVYSPTQNRIYFVPAFIASQPTWHYIDCNTGNLVSYSHGVTAISYVGGGYSPISNRIYLAPHGQTLETTWHYIDCNSGSVIGYPAPSLTNFSYSGGVYSPLNNRLYLVPFNRASSFIWHYIDCNSNTVVGYSAPTLANNAYSGGIYSPTQNRIYFSPSTASLNSTWHYIEILSSDYISTSLMAGPLFNKF